MLETAALFQHKKANADKLKAFGFRHQNCAYVYEHPLTETQLLMTVTIDAVSYTHLPASLTALWPALRHSAFADHLWRR